MTFSRSGLDPNVLRQLGAAIQGVAPFTGIKPARTGKIDDTTETLIDNPQIGLDPAYIWVRISFDNGSTFSRAAIPALCGVRTDFADYDVLTGYNAGGYLCAFSGRLDVETAQRYGSYMGPLSIPNVPAELDNKTVDNGKFLDGLIGVSSYSGLNISIQSFNSVKDVFPLVDPFDVSSAVPGSSGQVGWGVVSIAPDFDPTSMTTALLSVVVTPSTPVMYDPTAYAASNQSVLDAAETDYPAGNIRLGAVLLVHGQTVIDTSTPFLDLRSEYLPGGHLLTGKPVARTISSNAITTGSESVIVVSPSSGTSDTLNTITLTGHARELWLIASIGSTITMGITGNLSQAATFTDTAPAHLYHDETTGYVLASGGSITVTDGSTTLTGVTEIDFTSGATVSSGGGSIADVAVTGGGGLTHVYAGYNTIGASNEAWTSGKAIYKQLTLSADTQAVAIDVYLDIGNTNLGTHNLAAWILADNAGAPGNAVTLGTQAVYVPGNASNVGWLSLPVSAFLPAATYWLAVKRTAPGTDTCNIYYDTSGSDPVKTGLGFYANDGNYNAPNTNSTKTYSIRLSGYQ